jgi:hypothetical protein
MADPCYFTLPELHASFRLVTDDPTAARMVRIWARTFGDHVVDDRVVELPEDYGLPRLGGPYDPDADAGQEPTDRDVDGIDGAVESWLIRFSDLTLTLLAGSSPAVRARFDRMGVPYARATLDDPAGWQRTLAVVGQS